MANRLAWPLTVDGTRLARVRQNTEAHARQQTALIVHTQPGERVAQPRVGTTDAVGQDPVDVEIAVTQAVDRWLTAGRRAGPVTASHAGDEQQLHVHVPIEV